MSSSSNPLLEAKGITKYFGTITALENVNLKVHAGECLGVVGDNGAGKSTLMRSLSGYESYIENKLFATLDTTTKLITNGKKHFNSI